MPLISFIIPAYNAEKTLQRAVTSITQALSHQLFEILIIDDGSNDNTLTLAKQLAHQAPNIRVLTAGAGVAQARNTGIKHARGELIAFLDADDYYLESQLKKVLAQANTEHADLQIFSFEHGQRRVDLSFSAIDTLAMRCHMLEDPTNYMTVWGKFFKRSLLIANDIYFNEQLTMSEDSEFLMRYAAVCTSITTSPIVLYHYTIDSPSATRSFSKTKIQAYLTSLTVAEAFIASQPEAIKKSFLIYTLIQVNIIAVRAIYPVNNQASAQQKQAMLTTVLDSSVVRSALKGLPLKRCLTTRLLPSLFLKLRIRSLAILLFKIRSKQNYQKEH